MWPFILPVTNFLQFQENWALTSAEVEKARVSVRTCTHFEAAEKLMSTRGSESLMGISTPLRIKSKEKSIRKNSLNTAVR